MTNTYFEQAVIIVIYQKNISEKKKRSTTNVRDCKHVTCHPIQIDLKCTPSLMVNKNVIFLITIDNSVELHLWQQYELNEIFLTRSFYSPLTKDF